MTDVFYLACRYLAYHRIKTAVLTAAIAAIVYLPAGLNQLLRRSGVELMARAEATPLVIGAKGSRLELVLNSLYFDSDPPATIRFDETNRIETTGWGYSIPLDTRFRTAHSPIVGTTLDYFAFRGLRLAQGRMMAMLGECVLGAEAARTADVSPGGHLLSSPQTVLDIAGVYPLKMRVAGVLQPSGTSDDRAVFVDIKTAWVIEGRAHGHQDLSRPEAADGVLRTEGDRIVANASVVQYHEITAENIGNFHFHGDPATFPLTAAIVVPRDHRAGILLQGRYLRDGEAVQIVAPPVVLENMVQTVFAVGGYVTVGMVIVGLATLATMALVFMLSIQLRRGEIETLRKIGGSRTRIAAIIVVEIACVLMAGVLLAALLTLLTGWAAPAFTRTLVQWS
jgi:putative ABC transport system permease protein